MTKELVVMLKGNLLDKVLMNLSNEIFEEILSTNNIRIERIVSNGQYSEKDFWYEQEENEFIVLLKGNAILEFENRKKIELVEGDYLNIMSGVKHRVDYTTKDGSTIWLAVFY